MPEQERKAVEWQVALIRNQLAADTATVRQLQTQFTELSAQIQDEQARWTEINGNLDAMERSLPSRSR